MSDTEKYSEIIKANIALHSKMSEHYNTCEPHFKPENIQKVEAKLLEAINATKAEKLLDLGCGTGFMINIAKKYVKEITGVDVTQAMLDKVDLTSAKITLINHDTGSVALDFGSYDVVSAYSFLHHLYDVLPTFKTASNALKPRGKFYADLEPNYYFWEKIHQLDRNGKYDPIVKREIEMVTYKDEDIEKNFGVEKDIFNNAEFGKNIMGGFKEEDLREQLLKAGFTKVDFFYHWYIGQAALINDEQFTKEDRFKHADVMDNILQRILPLSKHLFKYVGFIATK
jgi:ubiquinone/menaquinone biosynthesis C-methylase UbiE